MTRQDYTQKQFQDWFTGELMLMRMRLHLAQSQGLRPGSAQPKREALEIVELRLKEIERERKAAA